jgi:Protein of unknown function (DUF3592)
MLKLFFRLALVLLGLWLAYQFGRDVVKPLHYKMTGEQVEGRVEGFLAGRFSPSMQPENTGMRNGKRKARRPVFRYPIALNSSDSLSGRNGSGVLFTFFQYNLNEKVTVVFPKNDPKDGYILSFSTIFVSFILFLFGLFMAYLGVARNM